MVRLLPPPSSPLPNTQQVFPGHSCLGRLSAVSLVHSFTWKILNTSVVGWIMATPKYKVLLPGTGNGTLFEKRVFAGVIKHSEMRFLWIMWVVPKSITSILIRDRQRKMTDAEEKITWRLQRCSHRRKNAASHQELEETRFFLRACRSAALPTPWFGTSGLFS